MKVEIRHLTKKFDSFAALNDINLTIQDGELFFLLGPSGCGKTTLLRCIGGFEKPTAGEIFMGGENVANLPPAKRNSAMVFQGYALWPHLTVRENISFGLEMQHCSVAEIQRRVEEAMEQVQITALARRRPNELSGGQQQRVALARTLVVHPGCLLLDEPLANLDAKLRRDMRREIRDICKRNHLTAVYVTHDRQEALSMADRVAVLKDGQIVQCATAAELYRHPVDSFVASFIGETNFLDGKVVSEGVETAIGVLRTTQPSGFSVGQKVILSIRPEAIALANGLHQDANLIPAVVKDSVYLGEVANHRAVTAVGGVPLDFLELNPSARAEEGAPVTLSILPRDVIVLPK